MLERIPFAVADITEAEVRAVSKAIRSGWITSGPEVVDFEAEFVGACGGGVHGIAVNSATAGLHLALEACGIGPGDEVIVPTWTFTATAEVVRYLGATPVLVDIDPVTLNVSLEAVHQALTTATRAIVPVHFAGLGVDIQALRDLVGTEVRIIEDAAHAFPTVTGGARVGACRHSDAAVFSFYATKTITTGEGGMVTTRDHSLAARMRVMRLHGLDRVSFDRYTAPRPAWNYDVIAAGYKYNMPDPAAAMGRVQLQRSNAMHARRSALADFYLRELVGVPVRLPAVAGAGDTHAWHLFVIRLQDGAPVDRDGCIEALAELGVATSVHFIPLHRMTYWRRTLALDHRSMPAADAEYARALSLPLFSSMSDEQASRVASAVRRVLSR